MLVLIKCVYAWPNLCDPGCYIQLIHSLLCTWEHSIMCTQHMQSTTHYNGASHRTIWAWDPQRFRSLTFKFKIFVYEQSFTSYASLINKKWINIFCIKATTLNIDSKYNIKSQTNWREQHFPKNFEGASSKFSLFL